VENNHFPKKLLLFFFGISPVVFFASGDFSPTIKSDFERSLEPLATFPFPGWLWGKNLEENHQQAPILLREMVHHRKKYSARTKYSAFRFHRKKHT
jgi:hypothetical protein